MKFKNIGIIVLILGLLFAIAYFVRTNSTSAIQYDTTTAFTSSIQKTSVVTGTVIPEDEVEIKPQLNGIISEIMVEEGDMVNNGDLIAIIKVVPDERSVYGAQSQVNSAELNVKNAERQMQRAEELFSKQIISQQEFEDAELRFNTAKENLQAAQNDLEIIRKGSVSGSSSANTNIRATITGTILEIPIKLGDQVIAANSFNSGSTVAIIADLNKMIFEGQVDEAEVGKLEVGQDLSVSMAAIPDKEFQAKLKFVAPKGTEAGGAVQFKIEADLTLDESSFIRAGYSGNGTLVVDNRQDIMVIAEALLQFDRRTSVPYVEVETSSQNFERRDITIGLSDGIKVEILDGLEITDKIKIWNKTEPIKIEPEESAFDQFDD
ncbi:efflux RND transporter periplasmic adaptor subunit [Flavobacteriaceae bacterium]|jgi:HlyD family secretion protein|nr:efflux RND transporter periplasmic adaptor subunit [Flavobacteriaceae bacterium]MDA8935064.1 efflux RND transporter periplasmic adaptor subunit [Flavobacteriaceae bacterium]MDA9276695.1 efflux RND transporter periplasmic adaptor subunit [Flavobacteriaceae bacterium]MDA9817479.1 efflux RND transporter periplasmic adaptor subunit [Flavobacteriaceae bacterium]MDA9850839.1 efflux RND transporter periplasmic adaptor subunit [Flavobacteriaceae bacterium]